MAKLSMWRRPAPELDRHPQLPSGRKALRMIAAERDVDWSGLKTVNVKLFVVDWSA